MKLNNKGFTLVKGLLVIIALSLVGGVSYFVYDKQSNKDNVASVTSTQQPTKGMEDDAPILPNGWVEFVDKEKSFSFAHPGEWGNATIKTVDNEHTGEGYKVTFSKSDTTGMITNQDYKYTGAGRGAAYWEIKGGSYAVQSQEIIDSAEMAKTSESYSTLLLDKGSNYVVSAYANCVDAGLVTNVLSKITAKQEYVFSLSSLKPLDDCLTKVTQADVDQGTATIFKDISKNIKPL